MKDCVALMTSQQLPQRQSYRSSHALLTGLASTLVGQTLASTLVGPTLASSTLNGRLQPGQTCMATSSPWRCTLPAATPAVPSAVAPHSPPVVLPIDSTAAMPAVVPAAAPALSLLYLCCSPSYNAFLTPPLNTLLHPILYPLAVSLTSCCNPCYTLCAAHPAITPCCTPCCEPLWFIPCWEAPLGTAGEFPLLYPVWCPPCHHPLL